MKPGLWETEERWLKSGGDDMSSSGLGQAHVQRMCVTVAMSKGDWDWLIWKTTLEAPFERQEDCARPKVSHSGARMTFETTCKTSGDTTVSRGETVIAPDQATTKVKQESLTSGTSVRETQMTMKFLGDDCGGLQPLDEAVKRAAEIKPGLWETRVLEVEADGKDMLEQMQKREEALARTQAPSKFSPLADRKCVSAAAAKGEWLTLLVHHEEGCTSPEISRSGNRMTFKRTCGPTRVSASEMASKVTAKVEVEITNETSVEIVMTNVLHGTGEHTLVHKSQMTLLGSDCGDALPLWPPPY